MPITSRVDVIKKTRKTKRIRKIRKTKRIRKTRKNKRIRKIRKTKRIRKTQKNKRIKLYGGSTEGNIRRAYGDLLVSDIARSMANLELERSDRDMAHTSREEMAVAARASPRWIPSRETSVCMICNKKFGLSRETRWAVPSYTIRHHCRNCGWAVCADCSGHSLFLDSWLEADKPHALRRDRRSDTPLRVCKMCFIYFLQTANIDSLRELLLPYRDQGLMGVVTPPILKWIKWDQNLMKWESNDEEVEPLRTPRTVDEATRKSRVLPLWFPSSVSRKCMICYCVPWQREGPARQDFSCDIGQQRGVLNNCRSCGWLVCNSCCGGDIEQPIKRIWPERDLQVALLPYRTRGGTGWMEEMPPHRIQETPTKQIICNRCDRIGMSEEDELTYLRELAEILTGYPVTGVAPQLHAVQYRESYPYVDVIIMTLDKENKQKGTIRIRMKNTNTILEVKEAIQDEVRALEVNIPPDRQIFKFAGKHLEDEKTLGDYNVSHDEEMHLILIDKDSKPEPPTEEEE